MKLDDVKLLVGKKGLEMYDEGGGRYTLQHEGEKFGTVSLREGSVDEYKVEFDPGKSRELMLMEMTPEQQSAFLSRDIANLYSRNLLREVIEHSWNLVKGNLNKYSVTTHPFIGDRRVPILYLFGEDHCHVVVSDLDTGKIKHETVQSDEYNDFIKGIQSESVSLAGELDDLTQEDNQDDWYMAPGEKYFWEKP